MLQTYVLEWDLHYCHQWQMGSIFALYKIAANRRHNLLRCIHSPSLFQRCWIPICSKSPEFYYLPLPSELNHLASLLSTHK